MFTNEHDDASRLLTTVQVAEILDLSRMHVGRLVATGLLTPAARLGDGRLARYIFEPAEVERVRRIRAGEIGDVLDRVDQAAAGDDPVEDRNAYTRAAWLDGIETVAARGAGEFSSGRVRSHVPEDATGPAVGALITSLVRRRRIEWTGKWDTLNDARNRHGGAPCKVYLVVGDLA